MHTSPATHRLRIHRVTLRSAVYLLTSVTSKRQRCFAQPDAAREVAESLQHYHENRHVHAFAWVVMPDHIHWLLQLRVGTLPNLMRGFKTWTSMRVKRLLEPRPFRVWMPGYHDHLVRPQEALAPYIHYVVMNPVRWGLVSHPKEYPFLQADSEVLDTAGMEPDEFAHRKPWE